MLAPEMELPEIEPPEKELPEMVRDELEGLLLLASRFVPPELVRISPWGGELAVSAASGGLALTVFVITTEPA